jgi:hypothetical protein
MRDTFRLSLDRSGARTVTGLSRAFERVIGRMYSDSDRLKKTHRRPARTALGEPSLRAMEEIAWVLRSDPKKNEVLFVKRTELTRLMRSMILHKGNA